MREHRGWHGEREDRERDREDEPAREPMKPGARTLTGALPHHAMMEAAFHADFSDVEVRTGERDAMARIGATAAAEGNMISFAASSPEPWLVAHELTHVMQHRNGSPRSTIARKATIGPVDSAPEREADRVADRVVRGEEAGAITEHVEAEIQRFSPPNHERSTVEGLGGAFAAEEIGEIYAANWERDMSQSAPAIGSAVVAWTAVKNAWRHGQPVGAIGREFQGAVLKLVNITTAEYLAQKVIGTDTSLGGYHTWEHMDRPGKSAKEEADKRWHGEGSSLAGYIQDTTAYIKEEMIAAVDVYRHYTGREMVGARVNELVAPWARVARPKGYTPPDLHLIERNALASSLPGGSNGPGMPSRDPIRQHTRDLADPSGADKRRATPIWSVVGQYLGRAMHAFQDFWAHSNWLKLAQHAHMAERYTEYHARLEARQDVRGLAKEQHDADAQLETGDFPTASAASSLGHELIALAAGMDHDSKIIMAAYGRTAPSKRLDSSGAQGHRVVPDRNGKHELPSEHDRATSGLHNDADWTLKELLDVSLQNGQVRDLVRQEQYDMADFLTNKPWLTALAAKGDMLVKQGDDASDAHSHAKVSNDQAEEASAELGRPGADPRRNADFEARIRLSIEADRRVFGPLRALMDEQDPAKALSGLEDQIDLVGRMLRAPTPSHPLWSLVTE